MARLQQDGDNILLNDIADPVDPQDAATKAYVDANGGGSNLTAGTSIDITNDVISATLADATNPGTIPALPQDFGTVYTEALKSDGQFHDDGTQWNLSDASIARSSNGSGAGQQYVAHTAGAGIEFLFNDDSNIEIGIASSGVDTTQIATGAVGPNQLATDISIDFLADVDTTTTTPVDDDVLTWNQSDTTWEPARPLVADIREGGHIDITKDANNHYTLAFNERFELWGDKSDWSQINTGVPTGNNILWDSATNTLTVPSVNSREIIEILGSARSGMAVQIRQENTSVDPNGFRSGFYQILDIDVTLTPEQVIIQLLPDNSDIFDEDAGNVYTYELTVLQFVSGGTLNNLTLDGLADVDVSTPPLDGQVLAWDNTNGVYSPVDNAGGGGGATTLGGLTDVELTNPVLGNFLRHDGTEWINEPVGLGGLNDVTVGTLTDGQILQYNSTTSLFENVDLPAASTPDLGDLGDVNTNGVADGFLIRYDGPNSNYRAHSVENTLAVYGGIISNRDGTLVTPVASGLNALAVGNDTEATGEDSIAIGIQAEGTAEAAIAIGAGATATQASTLSIGELTSADHANSTAIGEGAGTDNDNELRLGSFGTHVTVATSVAGNESEDNQLVSKRWVNNQISDASRVVSSTANALENLTVVTESTPWDDYRIVPGTALVPELQVHMYEFDSTESQFIFYPGFLSDAVTGDGANLTTGTIPDFFEEVTDIANEAEVTNAAGTAVTSLGWKYLGHDTAIVWQAVSHVYTFNFEWIYPSANSDGTQNPPDVTSSLELVRLKPLSDNTYNMNMNATVIASSPTSFHNAGSLNPGDSESFTGSYEFAQQVLADGISNVENGDVFAYRMKVRYKGNGFDGDTNVRLSITESETSNITPQIGIRHVGRDYSLTVEDSGDVQWTDHGSAIETSLVLIDNSGTEPVIPSASLGLEVGNGLDFTESQLDIELDGDSSGLALAASGLSLDADLAELNDVTGTVPTEGQVLTWDNTASLWGPSDAATSVTAGSGIDITSDAVSVDLSTNSGLAFNPLDTNSLFVATHVASGLETTASGLGINLGFGMAIDNSGSQQNELRVVPGDISLGDLGDLVLTTPSDGQILHYDAANTQWVNTTLAAGTDLTFNAPLTVSDSDVVSLNRGSGLFLDSSNSLAVNPGTGISVSAANGVFLNSGINGLTDVNTVTKTPTEGQFLAYDNTDGEWVPSDGVTDLADLSDVSATAPSSGQVLAYDGTQWSPSASGNEDFVEINFVGGDALPDIGLQARAVGIGPASIVSGVNGVALGYQAQAGGTNTVAIGASAAGTGVRSVIIGSDPSGGDSALAIAIGERAQVTATRGIAIGTSTDSSDANAEMCRANAQNAIAIGRAAAAHGTNAVAIGSGTDAGSNTDTNAVAIGNGASATGSSCNAIGNGASNTLDNSTVLGNGASHRVFAGSRELATADEHNDAAAAIACTIGSAYWAGDSFSPAGATLGESLKYTEIGNIVIGQFEFELVTSTIFSFKESDRWTLTSTSTAMTNCFGYASPSYGIALGTFTVAESATNSAAFGDFYLQQGTTESSVVLAFRVRSVIGTPPTRDAKVSCQFNLAKL